MKLFESDKIKFKQQSEILSLFEGFVDINLF